MANRVKEMRNNIKIIISTLCGVVGFFAPVYDVQAQALAPIAIDSRIKTFVYSENEVYRLVLHYGYQSHLQLDKNEEIQAISVGDPYAWKVTPVDFRIFIKPLEESAHTNMTIITDKHTYQFDLQSKEPGENVERDLVYQVRFFYPAADFDAPQQASANPAPGFSGMPGFPMSSPGMPGGDMMGGGMPGGGMMGAGALPPEMLESPPYLPPAPQPASIPMPSGGVPSGGQYNFNYTLTGPDAAAPVRVFDDGKKTYFEFPGNNARVPHVAAVREGGAEIALPHYVAGNFVAVDAVEKKFSLRLGQDVVFVYNERANMANGGR